jgi:hypothetical protein
MLSQASPRKPRILIISGAVLVAVLVLAIGAVVIGFVHHIDKAHQQECDFYVTLTQHRLADPVLYQELTRLKAQADC